MSIQKQISVCEICGKVISDWDKDHEEICRKNREEENKRIAEHRARWELRLSSAKEYAKKNGALVLLCENGFKKEARILAAELVWAIPNMFDCGTSHGFVELFDAMVSAASEK